MARRSKQSAKTGREPVAEQYPIAELKPDPDNVRLHDTANLAAIRASLEAFGQQKPIVVGTDDVVIAGNGTLEAAKQLGWEHIWIARSRLTGAQARAYAIADNRTAELATWDDRGLAAALEALREEDAAAVGATGFGDREIDRLLRAQEATEGHADAEPGELPTDPRTVEGDVWQLGSHRLLCGDSTKAEGFDVLMGTEEAAAVITDPPYGIDYEGGSKQRDKIANDDAGLEKLLWSAASNAKDRLRPGGCLYAFGPGLPDRMQVFIRVLLGLGVLRQTMVWVKDSLVLSGCDYHYQHESIFFGWKQGAAHMRPPDRKQTTIWECPRPKVSKEHPTMKPVPLLLRMLRNSTKKHELVLDPFAGSGSTLIACENLERTCRAIELSPAYCDVIVDRWERATGRKAKLTARGGT